ncbi:methylmalonyl-CoA mutase family protein, partial [uncultured Flavobacterium sp.]|uniref:methylmalonyl-CoA mutase family protein n=1 Tax=uncultured Flavobacterium sp. TaxID=165435 RepID=UPI002615441E
MANNNLFSDFDAVSSKQWKQQIQYELKGADYNETLVWESPEGIKVKPFYHNDDSEVSEEVNLNAITPSKPFAIVQNIFVHDVKKSNARALETLQRGAESVRFTLENDAVSIDELMQNLSLENVNYYFNLPFLSVEFSNKINDFTTKSKANIFIQNDPIGQLVKDGNWFENLEKDFEKLNTITSKTAVPFLTISSGIYQNAGANIVQQLAYTLAQANEYFNRIPAI